MQNTNRMIHSTIATVFLSLLFLAGVVHAADEQPIRVTSDKLAYDAAGRTVTFSGNVHVVHPDGEMTAKQVVLTLSEEGEGAAQQPSGSVGAVDPGQIKDIIATGDVFITMTKGQTGNSQKAVYNVVTGKLVMTGDPVLTDGANNVRGKIVTFFVKENRSEVVGNDDTRVEAVFSAPKRTNQ